MILVCSLLEHIVDGRLLTKNMAVGERIHLVARVATVIPGKVEEQGSGALCIALLHAFGGEGNTEKISKEVPDVVGGISGVSRPKEWGPSQPLYNRLSPFYHNTLNFVLLEKSEDQLRYIMSSFGRGRARPDANPDHDGAETAVVLVSGRTMCVETRWVDTRPLDLVCVDDVANLGTDSIPLSPVMP